MRLKVPRATEYVSEDGCSRICYIGAVTTHERGGAILRFEVPLPGNSERIVEGEALVGGGVSTALERRIARQENMDSLSVGFEAYSEFYRKLAETYGVEKKVLEYKILREKLSDESFSKVIDKFIGLCFVLYSSHFLNNDKGGDVFNFYPDTIFFSPINVDKKFYKTVKATEMDING